MTVWGKETEKFEELISEHEKQREEIENDPRPIWYNGTEYANILSLSQDRTNR